MDTATASSPCRDKTYLTNKMHTLECTLDHIIHVAVYMERRLPVKCACSYTYNVPCFMYNIKNEILHVSNALNVKVNFYIFVNSEDIKITTVL